jgi:hypothetical protein
MISARLALLVGLLGTAGCGLYFDSSSPPPPADGGCLPSNGGALAPLRNPRDGTCSDFGSDTCGGPQVRVPDWAQCDDACAALDEPTCLAAPRCRVAYVESGAPCAAGCPSPTFYGCWGTAPHATTSVGACAGLDAFTCSTHDNCAAIYVDTGGGAGGSLVFGSCVAEPTLLPIPRCDQLATEATCTGRADCVAIYRGLDCTCAAAGCTCASYQYDTCSPVPQL